MNRYRVGQFVKALRRITTLPIACCALLAASLPAHAQVSLKTIVELAQQKSTSVRIAQADVSRAAAQVAESRDVFLPSLYFGSGLPAFPEVGFTGALPTLWDATMQSMVFSMQQIRYLQAARAGLKAARLSLKDAQEQVALDASTDYIELDTVTEETLAARQQEQDAARMVSIEQQRTGAGVDPLIDLLQAQLTAAQLRLNRLHLETRTSVLAKELSALTGLPPQSIVTVHSSIPEVPAITGDPVRRPTPGIQSAQMMALSKERIAKGDTDRRRWFYPQITFGALYNRNTTLLNDINSFYKRPLSANNLSSGFNIQVPVFDEGIHDRARESAANALLARVQAEQAQHQNDVAVSQLSSSIRELDAQAEVAKLKEEISGEQLKSVMSQLELGNGAGAGAPAQLSPEAEQQALIDERQKYIDSLDAGFDLNKARLSLLRVLGDMQDWLGELQAR